MVGPASQSLALRLAEPGGTIAR